MAGYSYSNDWPLKIGLLLVGLTWFLFTFYEFTKSIMYNVPPSQANFWLLLTETASVIGLAFRTVAGFIAVVTILLYIFRKSLSKPEAIISLRWILIAEAIYWLSWFPSGLWAIPPVNTNITSVSGFGFFIETGVPCMFQSILIPLVVAKLVIELNPKKSLKGAIKWGLISGTVYIFITFWLNNASNWIYTVMEKGIGYITDYPLNLLSFIMTTVGLFVVALYTAHFSKKSFGTEVTSKLDLRRIGAIVTVSGLYYLGIYMLWLFFGSVGGWGTWYAWLLGHNLELWAVSLSLVGLPLLLKENY